MAHAAAAADDDARQLHGTNAHLHHAAPPALFQQEFDGLLDDVAFARCAAAPYSRHTSTAIYMSDMLEFAH